MDNVVYKYTNNLKNVSRSYLKIIPTPMRPILLRFSIGQPYHEGALLRATLQAIPNCEIVLADKLQRHTLELTVGDAELASIDLGEQWLTRNKEILGSTRIIRWDEYLKDPHFRIKLREVKSIYASDSNYETIVNQDITKFIERYQKRHLWVPDHIESNCLNYLLEESAVFLGCFQNYMVAYPGRIPHSITYLKQFYPFEFPQYSRILFKKC